MNASNSSRVYCSWWQRESDFEQSVKLTVLSTFGVFGALANIFVIILAVKYTVRTNLHHLIINMAVSDTCYMLLTVFIYFGRFFDPYAWAFQWYFRYVSFTVSLATLLVISIERYNATRQTLQRVQRITPKQRIIAVGLCWLIPLIVNAFIFYSNVKLLVGTFNLVMYKAFVVYLSCIHVCCIIVFIVNLVLSILSVRRLSRLHSNQAFSTQDMRSRRANQTRSAIRMVLASLLLYMFCWMPYFINFVLQYLPVFTFGVSIYSICTDLRSLDFAMKFLTLANCVLSPFIYMGFLPDFRKAAKQALCPAIIMRCFERGNSINVAEEISIDEQRRRRRGMSIETRSVV